ncbi:AAA family ATPase [Mucilaginibacter koreensis]
MKIRFAAPPPANEVLGRSAEIELIRQLSREGTENTRLPAELWVDPKTAFIVRPATQWMELAKREPACKALFGPFWTQGELSILFADTNMGKSVLAVQIANSITLNHRIGTYTPDISPEPVLYFDFELSTAQFGLRYREGCGRPYPFSPLLQRVVQNHDCVGAHRFKNYNEFIANGLENTLITSKARIVIIDNLSCLRSGTEGTAGAVELMQLFQKLKVKYKLSVLVLAHTPKRNPARPISRDDLQGSKMLINFADSAFAIGESHTQPDTRYLKQVKQRSGEQVHGANNVYLCQLRRMNNSLEFDFVGLAPEHEHLLPYTEQYCRNQELKIMELHEQKLSLRQIAAKLNIANSTVLRTLKRVERRAGEEG